MTRPIYNEDEDRENESKDIRDKYEENEHKFGPPTICIHLLLKRVYCQNDLPDFHQVEVKLGPLKEGAPMLGNFPV